MFDNYSKVVVGGFESKGENKCPNFWKALCDALQDDWYEPDLAEKPESTQGVAGEDRLAPHEAARRCGGSKSIRPSELHLINNAN